MGMTPAMAKTLLNFAAMMFFPYRRLAVVSATLFIRAAPAGVAHAAPPESRSAGVAGPRSAGSGDRVRFAATDERRRAIIAELTRGRKAAVPTSIDASDRQRLTEATAAFRAAKEPEARAILRKAAQNMRATGVPVPQIRTAIGSAIFAGLIATSEAERYADRIRFYTDALNLLRANKTNLLGNMPAEGAVGAAQIHQVSQSWISGASPDLGAALFRGSRAQFSERLQANENDIRALLHVIETAQASEGSSPVNDIDAREAAIMRALGAAAEAYAEVMAAVIPPSK